MQENNNNSLSRQKSLNSDLINLREDFDQFRITFGSKIFNSLMKHLVIKIVQKPLQIFQKKYI